MITRILWLCAMQRECDNVKQIIESTPFNAFNTRVDIVQTGIGTMKAGYTLTQKLLLNSITGVGAPDIIINTGCAGAHDPNLNIGDVVIGTSHIMSANVVIDDAKNMYYYGLRNDDTSNLESINISTTLTPHVEEIAKKYNVHLGPIASSDIWYDNTEYVNYWHSTHGTLCEDMEAATLSYIARLYNVPFIAIKDISNSVHMQKNKFDPYDHIVPNSAGTNSAKIAYEIILDINRVYPFAIHDFL